MIKAEMKIIYYTMTDKKIGIEIEKPTYKLFVPIGEDYTNEDLNALIKTANRIVKEIERNKING